jgi:ADP-heptose:LPS heptosyltransferase
MQSKDHSHDLRVLFLRFGSLGNAVVSIPAVRAVRKEKPRAFLALLCNPGTFDFWKDCPWLDRVLIYDQKGANRPGPGYLRMIFELRRFRFTHSVHFRRFIRSELIGFLSGAGTRIGFDPQGFSLLTRKIPYREDENIIAQNLGLVRELGVKAEDKSLEYWPAKPSAYLQNLLGKLRPPVIVVHPFAHTQRANRWPKFPELAERLQKELNAGVIIIGAGEEKQIFKKEWPEPSSIQTAFDLPIPELAALLKSAGLFIGSDSGPLHLACAVSTPAISIYAKSPGLQTHLKKWMPLTPQFKAVIPKDQQGAGREIPVSEVLAQAQALLSKSRA